MFFDGWAGLVRVATVGVLGYVGLVLLLRVSGKHTLSKMNAFDLVVTVALGSTLTTVLLSASVALAEGLLALALLILLQFAVTWLSVRSVAVRRLVKNEPKLLFHDGEFLRDAMRVERVTEEEVEAAVRRQGVADLDGVGAAVLETDGSVTVMLRGDLGSGSALGSVSRQRSGGKRGTHEGLEPGPLTERLLILKPILTESGQKDAQKTHFVSGRSLEGPAPRVRASLAATRKEARDMQASFPVSVEEVRQGVRAKGGALACPMCGGEGFTMEEVSVLASGHAEQYGTRHVRRAQLVCEDCGCVATFDPSRLRVGRQVGSAQPRSAGSDAG